MNQTKTRSGLSRRTFIRGATTAIAFGALAVIAVLSAFWPAWRAAALTPVEALRYER